MSYNVYTAEYAGVPNHEAIFIETNPGVADRAEAGRLYHVTGNLLMGMKFEPRGSINPEGSATFVPGTKKKIGTIAKGDLAKFEECCEAVPPPRAQLNLRSQQLYPGTPLYRCGDWLRDVQKLAFEKGIIRP